MTSTDAHPTHPRSTARGHTVIEARRVYKSYRLGRVDVPVLRGVDFAVTQGECVAVLGASGSGKSTLLHLLGGLDQPAWNNRLADASATRRTPPDDETHDAPTAPPDHSAPVADPGEVRYRGTPLRRMGPGGLDRFRTRSVGFVFQFYHLLPELSVLENAVLPARVGKGRLEWARRRAELRERAADLLTRFGLDHRLKHRPVELSGGERQRVAIARALINQPDLLLADEPTGNLDEITGAGILDALMELREERDQTMVIVTHDANTAARADRIVRLRDGLVVPD